MKKLIRYTIAVLVISLGGGIFTSATAQNHIVTGSVVDAQGLPLIGVNVVVKNQPGLGTNTDTQGQYKIKTGPNETLSFSYLGYATQDVPIIGKTRIEVKMLDDTNAMEEVVVVGAGYQKKASVVGAIASVKVDDLKTPSGNITNALAGNVPGIIAVQRSGEPGKDASEFWIRGISTFGANASALVLVDGIERNFNEINVEDIESFSVLKDASATAIYGNRGANGVILITTKRGKDGKVSINFKAEYGVAGSAIERDFVDAQTYATLANEARQSRYQDPIYDASDLEIIKYRLDPDLYPNVDWQKELLKKSSSTFKTSLNISGGGATARYFISGAYYKQGSIYNDQTDNDYGLSTNYKRYNFRVNTDINVTKTTILEAGLGGWVVNQHKPGMTSNKEGNTDDFWKSIANMTPITVPLRYSNGQLPSYGTSGHDVSPYVMLNHTGYQVFWENKVESNLGLRQNLNFITEGLNFDARFSYDAYNRHKIGRLKIPALYKAERVRDLEGNLITSRMNEEEPLFQTSDVYGDRRAYGEFRLAYDRAFGKHRVGGLVFFFLQSFSTNDVATNVFKSVPQRNMALSGRATYSYDDRYLFEVNVGYSGSENFEPKQRFGVFPAVAVGWTISNEKFIKKNAPWLELLKLRFSYGQVGNDRIGGGTRFPYLTTMMDSSNYNYLRYAYFGNMGANGVSGTRIELMGAQNLTWEVATKINAGIDLKIADRLELTVDAFRDTRENIFMRRGFLPGSAGMLYIKDVLDQRPWGNVGSMRSEGIDGNFSFFQKIGKDFLLTLRGNVTYAYTKVLKYDEAANALYYRMTQGYKWEQNRGLIALGLFKDQAEIASSPTQYGQELMPGDIKYKDVNGDGLINDDDIVPIGNTLKPELIYGFGLHAQWKNFEISARFQGAAKVDFIMEGFTVYPFSRGEAGNILSAVADPRNRWTSREISGDPSTERADAIFPRLAYGNRENNYKWSTWWLRSGQYLRLKELEIAYTLPRTFTRKLRIERARIFLTGYNLFCWSPFKWWDPEIGSKDGSAYPIQRTFNIGVNVNF